ncbi:hypothetical protein W911_13945 [Hyphomicrobium nitrativorans NL23]|uniref:DUF3828 domain-containing protein n=1 Tax=Hyphomicrobium nitrativorans NL23 TaxID=1029756 RepID=V5SJQ6_9HYPH|nr:hypothetical protein [Hyphomicrobium nitrativorans]AHB50305.1 hypothetical protein W911_13945 [Hyphomicrobium nitrativorans NL23]
MTIPRFGSRAQSAAVAVLLMLFPFPAAAGGSGPEVVLDEIFGQVEATCGGEAQGPPYDIYAIAETYFTPTLAQAFTAAMESGDLGFDILVDGQDCEIRDVELTVLDRDAGTATGRAIFKNMGESRIIDLKMTKTGDRWAVSDVIYQHRPFVLSDEL